ncbi:fatty acyl-AMP ligase [Streptomyces sp. JB150]|uniref:fatty acyl-AMP ligase n=1 Tax=Streptomyces sp. JB150 TaxID=2714844 RepID=UPI0014097771|nr:fatty acyl-AMP ligase [Streptomyces sp. JB150]QIJ65456.1 fatty acyl-AMP ligase [Streptomyces sp. JB150]
MPPSSSAVPMPAASPSSEPLGPAAAVRLAALRHPDATAMTFLDYSTDRAGTPVTLTYGQLHLRARALACLLSRSTAPGDRAAILCPHTGDYVVALLACLYTGVIAVPLYAPEAFRTDERLLLAMADCAPSAVLTTTAHEEPVRRLLADASRTGQPSLVCVDAVDPSLARDVVLPVVERPDDIAYLQYTSGSTRDPAGVEVTHRNLAVGAAQLMAGLEIGEDARIAGWLPFFHDMGLLLMIAVPLIRRIPVVLMAPFAFIQRPARWLRAISDHRATHTVSPNFGLDLCADRVPRPALDGLDLSSLRFLVNGSEPVRAGTLDRFTAAFAPYGFRPSAHCPSYGLAEATLAVTLGRPSAPRVLTLDRAELARDRVHVRADGDADGYRVVGCGTPADQEVLIVDPGTGDPVGGDRVGEVWVRGTNVCAGYWGRPERTAEVFRAALAGGTDVGWLRTGDLGFLRDGELYLTGRLKDLIVVDGRNHHPADLELTVQEADPAVRRGHVAVFTTGVLDEAGEGAVVVAELDRGTAHTDRTAVRAAIRASVVSRHALDVRDVALIRRGTMPKTTSGKIRRSACRDLYLARLAEAHTAAASDGVWA